MAQRRILKPSIVANSETNDGDELSSFDSLPNDVVAKILKSLPAQFLHNSGRFVCKTWAEILSLPCFKKSHLLHSQCGFLIQDGNGQCKVQSIDARDWELKETQLNFNFPGKIRGSSDGVLLINKSASVMDLYVANPVTMQVLKLPTLPSICKLCSHCNNIARASSTGEIKVVSLGRDSNGLYNWYVLTVGKGMSWRKINMAYAKCDPESYLSYVQSLSADGVIYWTNSSWINDPFVLAIDVHEEIAYRLKVPIECHGQYWTLVQIGKEICCMNCGKDVEMKVWKLKDLHRSEWVKVKSIRFSIESPLRKKISVPLLWLDSDVLVISVYVQVSNVVVAYHVKKDEYKVIKIGDVARHAIFLHTNSLIQF
ncbi:hypothetical protein VNO77_01533 [Canavalia gladiata]|uniref:F-box domain-containing protein n=1 Tax=Canavalia gladiata TaxID=3824 RepID=A0AAN9MWL2_CANGL